jgi:hypothetical protein
VEAFEFRVCAEHSEAVVISSSAMAAERSVIAVFSVIGSKLYHKERYLMLF